MWKKNFTLLAATQQRESRISSNRSDKYVLTATQQSGSIFAVHIASSIQNVYITRDIIVISARTRHKRKAHTH